MKKEHRAGVNSMEAVHAHVDSMGSLYYLHVLYHGVFLAGYCYYTVNSYV